MTQLRRTPVLSATLLAMLAACGQVRDPGISADPASLVRMADRTRQAGDTGTAIGLYRRAHEVAPNDLAPLIGLGATLMEAGAAQEALDAYALALKLQPENPAALRGQANAYLALNLPRHALESLAVLAADRVDSRTEAARGLANDMIGDHAAAQACYRRGLEIEPNGLALRNNLGLSFALAGDHPAAIATLRGVIETPGAGPRHRQNLALAYGLAGDAAGAAAVARLDLDEPAVQQNLAYYALLRSQTPEERRNAVFGSTQRARSR